MKEKILSLFCIAILLATLSIFYIIDNLIKAYTLFIFGIMIATTIYYFTKKGKRNLILIKASIDNIKTYSKPKYSEVTKQTFFIILIAIFLGFLIFSIDNAIRFLINFV